ncbi:MAG TPA: FAD-dependent oxidoreductase [Syntrophomonas sp.]|nr:FAD-dependent oxidoreductase [Syntrophomonas sp.]
MSALEIKENIYSVGVQNPDLRVFDIVMTTEYGTSYNAYLVKGAEKTCLIETVKDRYFDEYIANLQQVVKLEDIDYLIMNHTEPDHSGSVKQLADKIPGLTVMGSATALKFLKEITNSKLNSRELNHGDELDLGGKTLQFISAPFLHWPDSMYTFIKEDKILFSCDSFGCHYSDPRMFNDVIEKDFTDAYKYYFDMIMGPFKPYILEALEKIKDLDIEIICPGHGPILRQNLDYYYDLYRQWATPPAADDDERPKIVMAYVTAYGYTETISKSVVEGLEMIAEFNVKKFNLVDDPVSAVLEALSGAEGLLIGSPTINGDTLPPIWELLTHLSPIVHSDLVAAAFGAYGWSGEAVPNIEARLNSLRMKVLPGLRINFKPSEANLEEAFAFGMDFGKAILEKRQPKAKKKWRCLVCGQVFEGPEPPAVCPACGVGAENFVEEHMEDEFRNDTNDSFLIVGGGIAALSAAGAIRKRNDTAAITILSEEAVKPYYRPALSDYLSEDLQDKKFYVYSDDWYQENRVEVKTSCKVTAVDTKARAVTIEDGTNLSYNKLIIATGARSNIPPIPGADQQGVYALRSYQDAQVLKKAIQAAKSAVVIGGGVLGLEAVWEMISQGVDVSIIENNTRIMPRQLDEDASLRLQKLMTERGVKLYLGVGTEEISGDGQASGVKLNNGQWLPADLVLLSTGVKPNVELAQAAGINVDRGIVVDNGMRTSASDVFAAGDVAQVGDRLIGLWSISTDMGNVAGANAAGDWVEYKEPIISTMLAAFDHEIFSIGDVNLPAEKCRVTEVWDPVEDFYKKTYMQDGVLMGEIIIAPKVNTAEAFRSLGKDGSGKKRVTKWKCQVCGYIHEGPEPPDECPVCGAPKERFEPIG